MKYYHSILAVLILAASTVLANTVTPLDLRSVANMGFKDEVAADGKGGWTDQGSNDLRDLPTGTQTFCGVKFNIIDPASNKGKSCIVLHGAERPAFPVTVELKTDANGKYLYLLHASAFSSNGKKLCGQIKVRYADDSVDTLDVDWTRLGDWWNPIAIINCKVGWKHQRPNGLIGLYVAEFPLSGKQLKSITLESAKGSAWGIAAMTVSEKALMPPKPKEVIDVIGDKWQPIEYDQDIIPGSVLDFSSRLDAPAGKYGPVVIRNGRFEFQNRPGKPVRFYGTNICGDGNYMTKEWSDRVADRIAAYGFNLLRLHHHDSAQFKRNSSELREVVIDRMDYWIAALAKRGIYITTDIFVSKTGTKGLMPDKPAGTYNDYKAMFFLSDVFYNDFIACMKSILTHKNPYTGYQWKDDPAIVNFSLINENVIWSMWQKPWIREIMLEQFDQYCKERGVSSKDGVKSPYYIDFLNALYTKRLNQVRAELKKIGCTKPISDQNHTYSTFVTQLRSQYDYVDIHRYYDHPVGVGGSTLRRQHQVSSIRDFLKLPGELFAERLLDKPFAVTETEFAGFNQYRSESSAILGSYSAYQDWDMVVQFCYAHRRSDIEKSKVSSAFDLVIDPMRHLTHRFAAAQFLDGSCRKSPKSFAILLAPTPVEKLHVHNSPQFRGLGMIARVGTLVRSEVTKADLPDDIAAVITTDSAAPVNKSGVKTIHFSDKKQMDLVQTLIDEGLLPQSCYDPDNGIFRSLSGQLEVDVYQGTFKGVTKKSETLVIPKNMSLKGNVLSVKNATAFCSVGVIAPDGKDLKEAKRLLLAHLTDSSRVNRHFGDSTRTVWLKFGDLPLLAGAGKAEISLALPGDWSVYAIDTAGKRIANIPVKKTAGGIDFPVSVINTFGQTYGYELVRK